MPRAARPRSTPPPRQSRRPRPRNTDVTWETFSNGRVTSAEYAYLYATLTQVTPLVTLPGLSGRRSSRLLVEHEPDGADRRPGAAGHRAARHRRLLRHPRLHPRRRQRRCGLGAARRIAAATFPLLGSFGLKAPASARSTTSSRPMPSSRRLRLQLQPQCLQSLAQDANPPCRPRAGASTTRWPTTSKPGRSPSRPHQRTRNRPRNRHRPRTGEYLVLRASQTRGPLVPPPAVSRSVHTVDGIVAGRPAIGDILRIGSPISPA